MEKQGDECLRINESFLRLGLEKPTMKLRNVLSLFDGISCARLALERAGIDFENYYASEIDSSSIQVANRNFPRIIQLGDIKSWRDWDLKDIDLIIGGSPCQGFSLAGKRLNFDDSRSKLFFEFVSILKHFKPKFFLLENVRMKKEIQEAISEELGVEPILINSGLVSAQNRERLYWTNIPNLTQPMDLGIVMNDILEPDAEFVGGDLEEYFEAKEGRFSHRGLCHIGTADLNGIESIKRVYHPDGKSPTLQTSSGGNRESKVMIGSRRWRKLTPLEYERLQTVPEGYTEGISKTKRYHALGNGFTVDVVAHILRGMIDSEHEGVMVCDMCEGTEKVGWVDEFSTFKVCELCDVDGINYDPSNWPMVA